MDDRHAGLSPAFDLSRWSYFLDFALVPVAAVALLALARVVGGLSIGAILLAEAVGIVSWTLAEYWIHRLIFHGETPFEPMHDMHHRLPKDMIGIASWGTFLGFSAIWLLAAFFGVAVGAAFTAGVMVGYLYYCIIHVRFHHGRPETFNRYTAFMYRLHAGHHRGGKGNFGVSSPIWDMAFGTYRASR